MTNNDELALKLKAAAERAIPAMQRLALNPNDELFDEGLLNVNGDVDTANEFNILAGPENILSLLAERTADKATIAKMAKLIAEMEFDSTEKAENIIALKQRVAELETLLSAIGKSRPGGAYFCKWDGKINEVLNHGK